MRLTSYSDPTPTPAPSGRAPRRARLAIAVAAVLAGFAVLVVGLGGAGDGHDDDRAQEGLEVDGDALLRSSNGLDAERAGPDATVDDGGPGPSSSVPAPDSTPGNGSGGAPGRPDAASPGPVSEPSSTRVPELAPIGSTGSQRPGAGPAGVTVPGEREAPESPLTPAPPFYLPGSGEAPVIGPVTDAEDEDEDDATPQPIVDEPPHAVHHEPPSHVEEPPDRDEQGCPVLDLYPIGGYAENAPASFVALAPHFRAVAPEEWVKPALVCGRALEPWRDLVIQRLVTEGGADGALITAADGSSMVMRLSEIEWATYQFRYANSPVGPNLIGYPAGRMTFGNVEIVRTTAGGLVFPHRESMGVPVLGGAWDLWVAEGGPDGRMGLPTGRPESATGPIGADTWVAGVPSTGARQEFTNGWIFLPGVLTDLEAAAQPADRYEWHDVSELGPMPAEPIDYRGQVMQISGISFYVDRDGIRHWIRTGSAWSCATWDLGATEYAVRGHELARYPLGVEFVCDDYRD